MFCYSGPDLNQSSICCDCISHLGYVLHVPGIEEKDIESAYSALPMQQPSTASAQARCPVMLVRFVRREHRDKVMRARRLLKGSKYAVSEDLTLLNVKWS